jgi:hypothetical protein
MNEIYPSPMCLGTQTDEFCGVIHGYIHRHIYPTCMRGLMPHSVVFDVAKQWLRGLTIHWELASKYMSMLIDSQPTKLWYSTHVAENKIFLCQSLLMEYAASMHTCINSKVTTPKNVGRSKASNDTFSCRHGK